MFPFLERWTVPDIFWTGGTVHLVLRPLGYQLLPKKTNVQKLGIVKSQIV